MQRSDILNGLGLFFVLLAGVAGTYKLVPLALAFLFVALILLCCLE